MTQAIAPRNAATTALAAASVRPVAARPENEQPVVAAPPISAAEAELAALRAQMAALQAENVNLRNRPAGNGKVTFAVSKSADAKGTVSVYGINTKFPISMYPEAFVRFAEALMEGSGIRVLEEHAHELSVRVNGNPEKGTAASTAKVRELAARLRTVLGK